MQTVDDHLAAFRRAIENKTGRPLQAPTPTGKCSDDPELLAAEREIGARKLAARLTGIGIGRRYHSATLETYHPRSDAQRKALESVRRYIAEDRAAHGDGLLFLGEPGGGKSHLQIATLRAEMDKGRSVKYCAYGEWVLALNATYGASAAKSEKEFFDEMVRYDVLAIDDFFSIREGNQYEKLWLLLDLRNRAMKATLTATNLTVDEARQQLDERTRRRLSARVVTVDCPKEDA